MSPDELTAAIRHFVDESVLAQSTRGIAPTL
jgi:hypothetical protein